MDYNLIFCDLDGTLLDSNHQISPENIQAIRDTTLPFIIVSARMPRGITGYMDQLGIKTPVCAYNGSYIFKNGELINNKTIPPNTVRSIIDSIQRPGVHISIYQKDNWYINSHDYYSLEEQRITGIKPIKVDFNDIDLSNVNKILVISSLFIDLSQFETVVSIAKSKPQYTEITPIDCSKADAVNLICQYYGLTPETAVAIGDNYNDIPMIELVKSGILLANCPNELKNSYHVSKYTNDQNGVGMVIKKLLNN